MALTPAPAIVPSTLFIALPRLVARRAPHVDTDTVAARCEPVERQCIDLRAVIEGMAIASSATLGATGVGLEHRLPDATLRIWADVGALQQMLAYIVCIACDTMPRGGVLKTFVRVEGKQGVVSFMDVGAASEQPRLAPRFDSLFSRQAAATEHREIRACALMSRRIADDHRGRLYVAPSPLGGMGLTWRMPLAIADALGEAVPRVVRPLP